MATVREGNKVILLVVDVQVGVMGESWEAPRIIGNVSRAVDRARAQCVPVVWVQHSDGGLSARPAGQREGSGGAHPHSRRIRRTPWSR